MRDILIIVPSFKRQKKIMDCINAWRETTGGKSDFLLVLEGKDDVYPAASDIMVKVGDYGCVGKAINEAFKSYPNYKFYVHINDDHHLKTKGWEDRIIEVLKDGGFAYGNDLLQGEKLATAVFVSGETARKMGFIAVPELDHLFVDNAWMDIGKGINKLFYLPDVIVEHVHPTAGKAKQDDRYQAVNSNFDQHLKRYQDWQREKLEKVIKCAS